MVCTLFSILNDKTGTMLRGRCTSRAESSTLDPPIRLTMLVLVVHEFPNLLAVILPLLRIQALREDHIAGLIILDVWHPRAFWCTSRAEL